MKTTNACQPTDTEESVAVLQTCVPDYRLAVFDALAERSPGLKVWAGDSFFSSEIRTCAQQKDWYRPVENRFFLGRRFLWQRGVDALADFPGALICEFNPRILSSWWLLLRRRLAGRPTLLWGHAWGRIGRKSVYTLGRILMGRLVDGIVAYSETQARQIDLRMRGHVPVFAAPNSCVRRDECVAPHGTAQNIIYVGRLVGEKKPRLLLEAFLEAAQFLPEDAALVFVGEGSERVPLEERARKSGFGHRVRFVGHVSETERLRDLYAAALVAVSPGYVGLSAIQCMAFGVPMLISSDEPHSPEIEACLPGETAEFFETDSTKDLGIRLRHFFAQAVIWHSRRREISEFIARRYSIEQMVNRFLLAADFFFEKAHRPTVALVWAQYGPYHLARLQAVREFDGQTRYIGVEIASQTSDYAWNRENPGLPLLTLLPDSTAETAPTFKAFLRAVRIFRRERVRTVFVPSYWPEASMGILLAAKMVGASIVMMNESHGHTSRAKGLSLAIKRALVSSFDAALVGGSPQIAYFSSLGFPPDRIVDGYDVVDNEFFAREADRCRSEAQRLREVYELPPAYFLNIGRMVLKKNLQNLIKAYARVISTNEAMPRLVFVGSGPMEDELRDLCGELGLSFVDLRSCPRSFTGRKASGDVYFYGFRQAAELVVFYGLATAFILPSRWEEWGLVVNEAMASSLPVVVSNIAGCAPDLVHHGRNGFQFDPDSIDELAAHLHSIGTDLRRAEEMGRASREIVGEWGLQRFATNAAAVARMPRK